jgi:long-chain acyl-CoA synthetase
MKKCLIDYGVSSKMGTLEQSGKYSHAFYDKLIFSKVRESFGGCIRLMATGSAPLSAEVYNYMQAIMCCPLFEGYGQTESGAVSIFSRQYSTTPGQLTEITVQDALCRLEYSGD